MNLDESTREKIGKFNIFEDLSAEEIDAIIQCGKLVNFQTGETIIEESDESWDLYVVLSGRISIEMALRSHASSLPRSRQIAQFRAGEVFGDMAFLRGARRSASVTTINDFSALVFDRDKLYDLFDRDNHIGYIMVRNLAKIMSSRVMELNFMLRDS